MAHHQSVAEAIGGIALIAAVLVGGLIAAASSRDRLSDPEDDRTIHLDEVIRTARLAGEGQFNVTVYRQSGNVHSAKIVTGTATQAIDVALASFRRANIDAVNVRANSDATLHIVRMVPNRAKGGRGNRVGSAVIEKRLLPPTPD